MWTVVHWVVSYRQWIFPTIFYCVGCYLLKILISILPLHFEQIWLADWLLKHNPNKPQVREETVVEEAEWQLGNKWTTVSFQTTVMYVLRTRSKHLSKNKEIWMWQGHFLYLPLQRILKMYTFLAGLVEISVNLLLLHKLHNLICVKVFWHHVKIWWGTGVYPSGHLGEMHGCTLKESLLHHRAQTWGQSA